MRLVFGIAFKFFFRGFKVEGKENLPYGEPAILIANHNNSLMDVLVASYALKQRPHYLTRADVFNSKFLKWVFIKFQMLPIYRPVDGRKKVEKNQSIYTECLNVLAEKEWVFLFPEGSHSRLRRLREFKNGFAKIAVQYHKNYPQNDDLKIIPISINYTELFSSGGKINVIYQNPISVSKYFEDESSSDLDVLKSLKIDCHNAIKKGILHIEDDQYYEAKKWLCENLAKGDLGKQHEILEKINQTEFIPHLENLNQVLKRYKKPVYQNRLAAFITYPILTLLSTNYFIICGIPFIACRLLAKYLFKDDQFYMSVLFLSGVIIYPLFFLGIFICISIFESLTFGLGVTLNLFIFSAFLTIIMQAWKKLTKSFFRKKLYGNSVVKVIAREVL